MTDQIPADKVREILDDWERIKEYADWEDMDTLVKDIRDLLPTPARLTLADMSVEERAGCRWMQADVETCRRAVIIFADAGGGRAMMLEQWGGVSYVDHDIVTPRPDLPRLEWPGDKKPEEMTPVKVGDLIQSADDPRLAALPAGSVLLDREGEATTKRTHSWRGAGYTPIPGQGGNLGPWTVVRIGQEDDQ